MALDRIGARRRGSVASSVDCTAAIDSRRMPQSARGSTSQSGGWDDWFIASSASPIPETSSAYFTLPVAASAGPGSLTGASSASATTFRIAKPVGMRTTGEVCPTPRPCSALRNSGRSVDGDTRPSRPPLPALASSDTFAASAMKFSPAASRCAIRAASSAELTTMMRRVSWSGAAAGRVWDAWRKASDEAVTSAVTSATIPRQPDDIGGV